MSFSRSHVSGLRYGLIYGVLGGSVMMGLVRGMTGSWTAEPLSPRDAGTVAGWAYSLHPSGTYSPWLNWLLSCVYFTVIMYLVNRHNPRNGPSLKAVAGYMVAMSCFGGVLGTVFVGWLFGLLVFPIVFGFLLAFAAGIGLLWLIGWLAYTAWGRYELRRFLPKHLPCPGARAKLWAFLDANDHASTKDFHDPGQPG